METAGLRLEVAQLLADAILNEGAGRRPAYMMTIAISFTSTNELTKEIEVLTRRGLL
jgi:hypothetical protein